MALVSEYGRRIARKVPVFLHLNNQLVAISLILVIVRFRTLYVQFYTFFFSAIVSEDGMLTTRRSVYGRKLSFLL
jgi:hypothetical protein